MRIPAYLGSNSDDAASQRAGAAFDGALSASRTQNISVLSPASQSRRSSVVSFSSVKSKVAQLPALLGSSPKPMNVDYAQKIISQSPPVKPALASVVPISVEKLSSMPKVVQKAVVKVHNHQVHKFEKKLDTYNQARTLTGQTPLEPYMFNPGVELSSFWWKNDSRAILNPTVSASSS